MSDQETQNYISWVNKMILSVSFYYTLIGIPIEVLSNLIMLVVFLRKKFKKNTMGIYHQVNRCFYMYIYRKSLNDYY